MTSANSEMTLYKPMHEQRNKYIADKIGTNSAKLKLLYRSLKLCLKQNTNIQGHMKTIK